MVTTSPPPHIQDYFCFLFLCHSLLLFQDKCFSKVILVNLNDAQDISENIHPET
jgi:hypothetical protein